MQDSQPHELAKVLKPGDSPAERILAEHKLLNRLCKVLNKPATKEAGMLSVILASFKPYFREVRLEGTSDPNMVHDLQNKLDAAQIYLDSEVDGLGVYPRRGQQRSLRLGGACQVALQHQV
ncbi:hypothetical protein [Arthrobacter sp. zg-Y750]|uniref:hypothetical protein n=1 Tax=Arthrobacter sp. zg-Y750 TaxID=2894189 RepID=UPI001E540A13|nr:hypothetical protein [Arthrobacter sp. zg-Y750]MCC9178343.1 hypothetical protein [Arthrobacter sp. zg-Y750]